MPVIQGQEALRSGSRARSEPERADRVAAIARQRHAVARLQVGGLAYCPRDTTDLDAPAATRRRTSDDKSVCSSVRSSNARDGRLRKISARLRPSAQRSPRTPHSIHVRKVIDLARKYEGRPTAQLMSPGHGLGIAYEGCRCARRATYPRERAPRPRATTAGDGGCEVYAQAPPRPGVMEEHAKRLTRQPARRSGFDLGHHLEEPRSRDVEELATATCARERIAFRRRFCPLRRTTTPDSPLNAHSRRPDRSST